MPENWIARLLGNSLVHPFSPEEATISAKDLEPLLPLWEMGLEGERRERAEMEKAVWRLR